MRFSRMLNAARQTRMERDFKRSFCLNGYLP
jgi:hypothetical protein